MSDDDVVYMTSDVAIPQALLDAHIAGRLVLFVGAGASVASPSDLPLFDGLARRLAELARDDPPAEHESLDFFIGSMPPDFDAHSQTRSIIADGASKPNATHTAIVRLADASPAFRVVTTNFDDHLAQAAAAEGIRIADTWVGPALPLGDDFDGLVHLHGSVLRDARELVLTDRDFGRAYLTQAWATRFLLPMFQRFTVLFIGYSHDDPLMRYLALGLPSDTPRYVLTRTDDAVDKKWQRLHVATVSYPVDGHDHGALVDAIEAWSERARMGRLQHSARVAEIVAAGTTLRPVDRDYLLQRLRSADGARDFVAASNPLTPRAKVDWLRWIEDIPEFKSLFSNGQATDAALALAFWYANEFVASPDLNGAAFQTMLRLGQRLSGELFRAVLGAAYRLADEDTAAAHRWSSFLASSIPGQTAPLAADLFTVYSGRGHVEPIAVLRAMARPMLRLKPRWSLLDDEDGREELPAVPDGEVIWNFRERSRSAGIDGVFDSITSGSPSAGAALEDALCAAYDLMDAHRAIGDSDPLGLLRSAIEPHEQDAYPRPIDNVVDGLRDYGTVAQQTWRELPDRWWNYGWPLFRRLALHLISIDAMRSSEQKMKWLLDRSPIYSTALKHEIFAVLASAVGGATSEARSQLFQVVLAGPSYPENFPDRARHEAYSKYNMLVWLTAHANDWREAVDALSEIQDAYPDFGPREHPDFDIWTSGGGWSGTLPMTPEEFVQAVEVSAVNAVDSLLDREYSHLTHGVPDWDDALSLVGQAVSLRQNVGIPLWHELDTRDDEDGRVDDVRRAIIGGWAPSPDLGAAELEFVATQVQNAKSARSVSELLVAQARKHVDDAESFTTDKLRQIAHGLWRLHSGSFEYAAGTDPVSSVPLYLNSWPGEVAQYWLTEIDRRWRHDRDAWSGLNEEEWGALSDLLNGPQPAWDASVPALAGQLFFLFSADSEFTSENLLPLFLNDSTSRLMWVPYLYGFRYDDKLLAAGLLEGARLEWGRLDELGDTQLQHQFFSLVASVLSFAATTADARQSLLDPSVLADAGAHAPAFAEAVVRLLKIEGIDGAEVWRRWLGDHVRARLDGLPRVASTEEIARWCDVVPYVGDEIPTAVAMFGTRAVGLGERFFEYDLPDDALKAHGAILVQHYAERFRNSAGGDPMLGYQVKSLIDKVREALGDTAAATLTEAAESSGLIGNAG